VIHINPILIVAIIAGVVLLYIIGVYNDLASLKARIKAAIQEIGNQLKRQAELIPNLEESVKGYFKQEKDIVKMLADARKLVDAGKDASDKISQVLPKLQILVESNPQIKGAEVVTRLMDELRDTSDKVMYSRRTMIDLTADYNIKLVTFPTNLVAQAFSFQPEKGLETPTSGAHLTVSEAETRQPKVKLN
jgi:LemA protein